LFNIKKKKLNSEANVGSPGVSWCCRCPLPHLSAIRPPRLACPTTGEALFLCVSYKLARRRSTARRA